MYRAIRKIIMLSTISCNFNSFAQDSFCSNFSLTCGPSIIMYKGVDIPVGMTYRGLKGVLFDVYKRIPYMDPKAYLRPKEEDVLICISKKDDGSGFLNLDKVGLDAVITDYHRKQIRENDHNLLVQASVLGYELPVENSVFETVK